MWKYVHPVPLLCLDSNPRPSEHESLPITTRPLPRLLFIAISSFERKEREKEREERERKRRKRKKERKKEREEKRREERKREK